MRVRFRTFRAKFETWRDLFQQAADFASSLGPDHLIAISHSDSHGTGVVTVWYWSPTPGLADGAPEPTS